MILLLEVRENLRFERQVRSGMRRR
jgi:hypothetical protein